MKTLFVLLFLATNCVFGQDIEVKITAEEMKLYHLIMDYRKSLNLETIPLSKSLTYVAQTHSKDLALNKPDIKKDCNAHSWSNKGKWSPCCYTPDHKQSKCMWDKPRELTKYKGNGFEIAYGSSEAIYKGYIATAEEALKSWKESTGHNNVITNKGSWKDIKWNAIGIGIYDGFTTVWFGEAIDIEGEPK